MSLSNGFREHVLQAGQTCGIPNGRLIREFRTGPVLPASVPDLLASRDRTQAGPTAPPQGLVLDEVFYLPGNADPHTGEEDEGDE